MAEQQQVNTNTPSLHRTYQDAFLIGAAVNAETIQSSESLLTHHFNSITAENDMKFERLHPGEDVYTFETADALVGFAARHNMKMRGHTLVWHNQTPAWVFQDDSGNDVDNHVLIDRLRSHINTVMGRYKQQIYAWDVVNEAIEDKRDEYLRDTPWLRILGPDYLKIAFELAHQADPDALLFYNDYNETNPTKREKIYRLVKSLLDEGVPVHGIGMQGHWNLNGPSIEEIKETIELYASLGVQIQLTELDVSMFDFEDRRTDLLQPTPDMLERQATRYEQIFNLLKQYQDVVQSVTFWGVADDYTWLHDFPVKGRRNWPFLFNESHQPKDSFWRIVGAAGPRTKTK